MPVTIQANLLRSGSLVEVTLGHLAECLGGCVLSRHAGQATGRSRLFEHCLRWSACLDESPQTGREEMELWQTGNTNMPEEVPRILEPPSAADPILAEVVRRLQELYHPEQIYLFGSTARGESGPDSDYDLMVVVADSTPVSLRDSGRAYKAIWRLGVATDVLVWTHSDFEKRLQLN